MTPSNNPSAPHGAFVVSLEQLLDSSPVPTFVINAEHVITHWNKGCEQVIGIPASAMLGTRNQWRAFYARQRPVMADIMIDHGDEDHILQFYSGKYRPSASIPGAYEAEDFFPHMPGGGRWLFFTAARLYGPDGRIVGAIETLQDVTQRKVAELKLQNLNETLESRIAERTTALEEANRELRSTIARMEQMQAELLHSRQAALAASQAKSDFLATMSHEIRTPMNGIIGMTELVLDTTLSDEQREYMGIVKSSADGLVGIINDILDFSKMEAGKLALEHISFNLHGLVTSVMKPMAVKADEKKIELICDIDERIPLHVLGDPGRIRQVLINLLGNALKFTDQGEVELKVALTTPDPRQPTIRFSVRDSGIGIASEKQQHIFEAFTQADTSTTRQYGGTGLGLSISSRLVALMGGSIGVTSAVGQGSIFAMELPLQIAPEHRPVVLDARNLVGKRALIVDDNAVNRRIFREMLLRWGLAVEEENSALALLNNLEQRQAQAFDLVITDYHMPGMDGFGLIERIRRDDLFPGARLVMLSSAMMPGQGARCEELGVAAYLTKPVERLELFAALNRVLAPAEDAERPKPLAPPPKSPGKAGPAPLSILVAEDNAVNQKLIRTLLEQKGHRVTLAGNGREAVQHVQDGCYDIVFMDVQMPVLGGLDATREIRAWEALSPRRPRTPIHALTAAVLPEVRDQSQQVGIDGYLTKPIDRQALYAVLEALPRRPAPSPEPVGHFDYRRALDQCDREIVDIIAPPYLEALHQDIEMLREAFRRSDLPTLERIVHTHKGLAQQFNARPLAKLFAEAERLAHSGHLDEGLIDNCCRELAEFCRILAQNLDSTVASPCP